MGAGSDPAAGVPPAFDRRVEEIVDAVSAERIEADIRKLVGFGTRHTLSDTVSETQGIGAARRWIRAEFEVISGECGGCLEVYFQRNLVEAGTSPRVPEDTWVVNVVAVREARCILIATSSCQAISIHASPT